MALLSITFSSYGHYPNARNSPNGSSGAWIPKERPVAVLENQLASCMEPNTIPGLDSPLRTK